jgi:hypothetical protein
VNSDHEKYIVHSRYRLLICILIIIAVITEKWSSSQGFTTYLSNAATLTSLMLGVVAIFYSFISNESMSRSLGSITTITSEVQAVRDEIKDFSHATQAATESVSANNLLVKGASDTLTSTMETLRSTLTDLALQNEALRDLVVNVPDKLDKLDAKVVDLVGQGGEKAQAPQALSPMDLSANAVRQFLNRAALVQNLIAIACVLAYEKKKNLVVADLCEAVQWEFRSACVGFISCMHAVQLCERKAVSGSSRTYKILGIHPELKIQAKQYFVNYISDNFEVDSKDFKSWSMWLANVENLFADNVENE